MAEVQFREMEAQEGRKMPAWQLAYGVDEDGEFYLPGAIAGDEQKVMMSASFDGISVVTYKGHLYVPLSWAKKEFPAAGEVWTAFEKRVKDLGLSFVR